MATMRGYATHDCTFCAQHDADAQWDTKDSMNIYVCRRCAVDILPNFIADAVMNHSGTYRHNIGWADENLVRIGRAYFRTVAYNLGK